MNHSNGREIKNISTTAVNNNIKKQQIDNIYQTSYIFIENSIHTFAKFFLMAPEWYQFELDPIMHFLKALEPLCAQSMCVNRILRAYYCSIIGK